MREMPPKLEEPGFRAALPLPPEVANSLRNMEQSIFGTYANTDERADAFDLLTQLQEKLHKAPTRASLVPPKPQPGVEPGC